MTLWRVFERLDATQVEGCLQQYGQGILSALADKHISLDGKQMRGSGNDSQGNLHIVSAWLNATHLDRASARPSVCFLFSSGRYNQ